MAESKQPWDYFIPEMVSFAWLMRCYVVAATEVLGTHDLSILGVPLLVQCGRLLAILINENDLNPSKENSPAPQLKNHKGDVNKTHHKEFLSMLGTVAAVGLAPLLLPSVSGVLYLFGGIGIWNAMLLDSASDKGQNVATKRVKYFPIFFMYLMLMVLADFRQRGIIGPDRPGDKGKKSQANQTSNPKVAAI